MEAEGDDRIAAEDDDRMEVNRMAVDGPVLGGGKRVRGFRSDVRLDQKGGHDPCFATQPGGRAQLLFCLVGRHLATSVQ